MLYPGLDLSFIFDFKPGKMFKRPVDFFDAFFKFFQFSQFENPVNPQISNKTPGDRLKGDIQPNKIRNKNFERIKSSKIPKQTANKRKTKPVTTDIKAKKPKHKIPKDKIPSDRGD